MVTRNIIPDNVVYRYICMYLHNNDNNDNNDDDDNNNNNNNNFYNSYTLLKQLVS